MVLLAVMVRPALTVNDVPEGYPVVDGAGQPHDARFAQRKVPPLAQAAGVAPTAAVVVVVAGRVVVGATVVGATVGLGETVVLGAMVVRGTTVVRGVTVVAGVPGAGSVPLGALTHPAMMTADAATTTPNGLM